MKTQLVKAGKFTYRVRLEPSFDGGNAVYVNGNLVADIDHYPTEEELVTIIEENIRLEGSIKDGFAASGVFE